MRLLKGHHRPSKSLAIRGVDRKIRKSFQNGFRKRRGTIGWPLSGLGPEGAPGRPRGTSWSPRRHPLARPGGVSWIPRTRPWVVPGCPGDIPRDAPGDAPGLCGPHFGHARTFVELLRWRPWFVPELFGAVTEPPPSHPRSPRPIRSTI